ncbi:MAG TPA: hypothetical protein VKU19_14915 [Bryobacteraceae bacterium]|nr:hypothetical protein [Bryobacteraceae bacterium]
MANVSPITSVRSKIEERKPADPVPAGIVKPDVPEPVAKILNQLLRELTAAQVPIQSVDAHAIEMAARCMDTIRQAEEISSDPKTEPGTRLGAMRLGSRAGRDLQKWLEMIGATPGSRARLGIRTAAPKPMGVLERLLAARLKQ